MTESSPIADWYSIANGTPGQRYFDGTHSTERHRNVPVRRIMSEDERAEELNKLAIDAQSWDEDVFVTVLLADLHLGA